MSLRIELFPIFLVEISIACLLIHPVYLEDKYAVTTFVKFFIKIHAHYLAFGNEKLIYSAVIILSLGY